MKSILSATACAAVMAFAIPALAATDDTAMPHHHHMMHGKHGMMKKGAMSGSAETEKLNEQSLQNAKSGVMPASSGTSATAAPTGTDTSTMTPGSGNMTPGTMTPASGGAMAAPGTGMSTPPASGAMGTMTPGNAPPITTPPAAASSSDK